MRMRDGHGGRALSRSASSGREAARRIDRMSSTVLARKYRPRNFESLVGPGARRPGARQRPHAAAACTTPTCSPARAASARRRSSRILAKSPQLHRARTAAAASPRSRAACAQPAPTSTPAASSTTSSSTRRRTAASTRSRACSSRRSTSRCVGRFKVFMIDEVHMLTEPPRSTRCSRRWRSRPST